MTTSQGYDAIVVGAGIAGLTAAAYLQASGQRTLLLEQYDVLGGSSHVFRRRRVWEFEVGVHYLGDCGPGGRIPTMLSGLGLADRIEFLPMDESGFDTIAYPDFELQVPVGWEHYLNNLLAAFPGEEAALRRAVGTFAGIGSMISGRPPSIPIPEDATAWVMRPLADFLDACGLAGRVRSVLSTQFCSYGCPPSRAPVGLHAGFLETYVGGGAYYPEGGGQVFAGHLVDVLLTHGATVRTRARVDRILVEGGRVQGVRLTGGETFAAPVVVAAGDLQRTMLELVGREHLKPATAARIGALKMSAPWVNVYLGVDVDLRDAMPKSNYFSMPSWDQPDAVHRDLVDYGALRDRDAWLADAEARLPGFVHCSTVKDPDNPRYAPAGSTAIEVMTLMPAEKSFWGAPASGRGYRREDYYHELKNRVTEILVERVRRVLPQIDGHVTWQEASTPLTQERYTRSSGGSAYGIEANIFQFGPGRPRARTEIDGLFLAGASTAWGPAIEGSMLSGVKAASRVVGRDLMREVAGGVVLADPSRLTAGGPDWDPLAASRRHARPARTAVR